MVRNNTYLVILFIITAAYFIPVINLPLAPYDEAVILVGADKILHGQVPHKDFSSEYPVGQLYALAAFFKLFGTSVFTERVYDLLIKALLSLSIFLIVRFLSSNAMALLGWLMSLLWLQHSSFPVYPVYPALLSIYVSIYWLFCHMKERKHYYIVLSAMAIVCAVLFRHDLGGYAAIVITVVLIFRRIMGVQAWTPLLLFLGIGITAGLVLIVYFSLNSAISFLLNDLVLIPMAFREYQVLPYPSLARWNLPFYIFPLVLVLGAITSILLIKRKKDDPTAYVLLLISFTGIFFFNQVQARSDVIHLLPVALTGIMLAPILLHILSEKFLSSTLQRRVATVAFIIAFGITLSKPIEIIMRFLSISNGYIVKNVSPDIERASHLDLNADLKDVVTYIKQNTLKSENIYVGVKNHDKFVFNDVIIYFLSDRTAATRYHVLNPGVHTTLNVQEEVVNELKSSLPRLIVLVPRSLAEPNLSNVDTQIELLDNYILSLYELKKTYGIYEIWVKKM